VRELLNSRKPAGSSWKRVGHKVSKHLLCCSGLRWCAGRKERTMTVGRRTNSRRQFIQAGAALGASLAFSRHAKADPKPIGFIYVGPKMDYGYNYSMDQGRLFVEKT